MLTDPFAILIALAEKLGWSEEATAVGIGALGVIIASAVISLAKGNISGALRLVAIGAALITFALFSKVADLINAI